MTLTKQGIKEKNKPTPSQQRELEKEVKQIVHEALLGAIVDKFLHRVLNDNDIEKEIVQELKPLLSQAHQQGVKETIEKIDKGLAEKIHDYLVARFEMDTFVEDAEDIVNVVREFLKNK